MTQPEWPDLAYRALDGGPDVPINTQLTVDCDDPHAQAAFWAAALGYLIEDGHEFVEAVVAAGFADRERDTIVIDGRLAWRTGTGIKHPDDVDGPRGSGRRILFVAVPDRAPGKNKWHLDLNVGRRSIEAEVPGSPPWVPRSSTGSTNPAPSTPPWPTRKATCSACSDCSPSRDVGVVLRQDSVAQRHRPPGICVRSARIGPESGRIRAPGAHPNDLGSRFGAHSVAAVAHRRVCRLLASGRDGNPRAGRGLPRQSA
jgi:hypothetical protein